MGTTLFDENYAFLKSLGIDALDAREHAERSVEYDINLSQVEKLFGIRLKDKFYYGFDHSLIPVYPGDIDNSLLMAMTMVGDLADSVPEDLAVSDADYSFALFRGDGRVSPESIDKFKPGGEPVVERLLTRLRELVLSSKPGDYIVGAVEVPRDGAVVFFRIDLCDENYGNGKVIKVNFGQG
ncbi:MAG: hypothetical protein LBG75_02945 [Candidatus Nomurabacteria bacterium]|jgi:hypothetical protein|nr:hypothetical protein [Candidatus Nomurabacteria bacterium]